MNFVIGWPQGIYLIITLIGLIIAGIEHGKPREPGNVWYNIIATFIAILLLLWGGFFG